MLGCVLVAWLTLALGVPASTCSTLQPGAVGLGASGPTPHVWVLRPWLVTRGLPRLDASTAERVFVLAHELGHVSGQRTEPGANRWARRHYADVVRRLGRGTHAALLLWRRLPPEWKALPGVS